MTSQQISEKLERIEARISEIGQTSAKPFDLVTAAEYLGISRSHLYQLTSKNMIGHFKPAGKKIYFDKSDLDEYLRRNRVRPSWELEAAAARA